MPCDPPSEKERKKKEINRPGQTFLTFKPWQFPLYNEERIVSDGRDCQVGKEVEKIIIRRLYYSNIIRLGHLLIVRGLMGVK